MEVPPVELGGRTAGVSLGRDVDILGNPYPL
jgi:hypothetical protein